MRIEFDQEKRNRTLASRGLDFRDAGLVFEQAHFDRVDDRKDYGETRVVSTGVLNQAVVVMVWTERVGARRIISMRKADNDERKKYFERLDRSG